MSPSLKFSHSSSGRTIENANFSWSSFRAESRVSVESIPVVDLTLERFNDKLARSVPALFANLIQLSNDTGWEIQSRRYSDDFLEPFPQQQRFEIYQRVGFFHGSEGVVTPRDSLNFLER